jgi:hypothetical protein
MLHYLVPRALSEMDVYLDSLRPTPCIVCGAQGNVKAASVRIREQLKDLCRPPSAGALRHLSNTEIVSLITLRKT